MASVDATPALTTTLEEQTVAWEQAKDLPFIGTDASLADKSGFKSALSESEPLNKSMMKSKPFGQSKPLESDLLANIEESELDDLFASGNKTLFKPSSKNSSYDGIKSNETSDVLVHTTSTNDDTNTQASSMKDTITKVELEDPQNRELLHVTTKIDQNRENSPAKVLSPQKQTSDELLQVLNVIDSNFPKAESDSNKNKEEPEVRAEKPSDTSKPQRQKSIPKDAITTADTSRNSNKHDLKPIIKKETAKSKAALSDMSTEDMINAAEALALKAKHSKSNPTSLPPKKPPISPSDNKNPRHKSRGTSSSATASELTNDIAQEPNPSATDPNGSKRKSGLPPIVKRPTPRNKKEDQDNKTGDESSVAEGESSGSRNRKMRRSAASIEPLDDDESSKNKLKGMKRNPRSLLPDLVTKESSVQVSPVKNAAALSKKRELVQQYTRKPNKDVSKIKLPPISTKESMEDGQDITSQETPGRAAPPSELNPRASHSSPPFSRNSNIQQSDTQNEDNNSLSSPTKKRRKPLYLRMIAKAQKLIMDEEKKKQEDYNRLRAMRPKNTPSRAELKDHVLKFEEYMKSKAELSRQNHISQVRALKEQRKQQNRQENTGDDEGSVTSLKPDGESVKQQEDNDSSVANDKTPIKGAAKAKLQKELEKFDHITHVLAEQKKERDRHYKGLLKKAGLIESGSADQETEEEHKQKPSPRHHHHDDEITPTKQKKHVKTTMSMHVVTIGDDPATMQQLSPRQSEHDTSPQDASHQQHSGNKKKTPRQITPHRSSHATFDDDMDADVDVDGNRDDNGDYNNGEADAASSVSFNMMDVLDDEARDVLNHHRHAGEAHEDGTAVDATEGGESNGQEEGSTMVPISLADYIPALNEQPLPETVKVSEGFFDEVLNQQNADGDSNDNDIVKVITGEEEEEDNYRCDTSLSKEEDLAATMTVVPLQPVLDSSLDMNEVGNNDNLPDLTEKEVAYFVADDWIDMLANTSMSMDNDTAAVEE